MIFYVRFIFKGYDGGEKEGCVGKDDDRWMERLTGKRG